MNFDNAKIMLNGFRAIGLKDSDIEKFNKAQESSFGINEKVTSTSENQVINNAINEQQIKVENPTLTSAPVPPIPGEKTIEQTVATPGLETAVLNEKMNAPINEGLAQSQTPIQPVQDVITPAPVEEIKQEANIFDMPNPMPEIKPQVQETPVIPQSEAPAFDMPTIEEKEPVSEPSLETPTDFYKAEAQLKSNLNGSMMPDEDPALVYLDSIEEIIKNTREIIEGKNKMINALNDKINLLTGELTKIKSQQMPQQEISGEQRVLTPNNNIFDQAA